MKKIAGEGVERLPHKSDVRLRKGGNTDTLEEGFLKDMKMFFPFSISSHNCWEKRAPTLTSPKNGLGDIIAGWGKKG